MVLELENELIIDNLSIAEEVLKNGREELRIPRTTQAVGLFFDWFHLLTTFIGRINLSLEVKYEGYSEYPIKPIPGLKEPYLDVIVSGKEKLETPEEVYENCHLRGITKWSGSKCVCVSGRNTTIQIKNKLQLEIKKSRLLSCLRKSIVLPLSQPTVTLHFEPSIALSSFPFNTIFYNPKPCGKFNRERIMIPGTYFPVSSKENINLSEELFHYIYGVPYWDSRFKYCAEALNILAQTYRIVDATKKHKRDLDEAKGYFKECFPFVLAELGGIPLDEIIKQMNCPSEFLHFCYNSWLKTKNYFLTMEELGEYMIRNYNEIVHKSSSVPLLTMGFEEDDAAEIIGLASKLIKDYSPIGHRYLTLESLRKSSKRYPVPLMICV